MKFIDAFVNTLLLMALVFAGAAVVLVLFEAVLWGLLLAAAVLAVVGILAVLLR